MTETGDNGTTTLRVVMRAVVSIMEYCTGSMPIAITSRQSIQYSLQCCILYTHLAVPLFLVVVLEVPAP
jgi:hypothetical protein